MIIEVYEELCCDLCNEIIHTHIDCPACDRRNAGTSIYGELEKGETIKCENCGASFLFVGLNDNYEHEFKEQACQNLAAAHKFDLLVRKYKGE